MSGRWAHSLQHISAYKRCDAHLTTRTTHGAIVTLLGVLLGVTLTIHELAWFMNGGGAAKTAVDLQRRHNLAIHMDITFPAIPCAGLSVDVVDASGSSLNDVSRGKDLQIHKMRLDAHGRRVTGRDGEYHTPQSQKLVRDATGTVMQIDLGAAMTQMGDMEKEIEGHEGCRIMGDIVVRRVAGKLHFAVHQQSFVDVLPQMLSGHRVPRLTNMSHVIRRVAFGPDFPGQANPLDGFSRITREGEPLRAYKYFLKIVPTEFKSRFGRRLETNQYSVNEYSLLVAGTGTGAPAAAAGTPVAAGAAAPVGAKPPNATAPVVSEPFLDFAYDLSPIMMTVAQSPADLLHFLVRLCAVVGGVLSVTRMADKLVHGLGVAAGLVHQPPSAKARHSGAGYSSTRTSLAGLDASLPGSGRSSYAGGGGGSPHTVGRGSSYSSNGGVLPDAHQRGSIPGSHPLSHMNSNASSMLHATGSLGGAGAGALPGGYGGSGSFGGAAMMQQQQQRDSYGGYGVAVQPQGSGSWGGGMPAAATGAYGGGGSFGGAAAAPLHQTSSGGMLGGPSSGGGAPPPHHHAAGSLGGFSSAPLASISGSGGISGGGGGYAGAGGLASSRLSTASGPGSRPASGPGTLPPASRAAPAAAPGSPLKQQQY